MTLGPDSPHFHIHWTEKKRADWQRFATRAEVHSRALELVQRGETFTIEEYSEDCPACEWLRKRTKTGPVGSDAK